MWKVLLADDEAVILKGLKKLIDWSALDVEIVGEATDGLTAARLLEETRPDLVVSDIRMPGLSGLELLERARGGPKFIFVTGYEEFEYVRQALSGGAVEYLLKPVSSQALEKAVRKALGIIVNNSAAALFRQSSVPLQDFFSQLTENREFAEAELYQSFTSLLGGKEDPTFMGLCFGMGEEAEQRLSALAYERQLLQSFTVLNTFRDDLERSGYGCFLRKDERRGYLMGIFSPGEDPAQVLAAALDRTEAKTGYRLRVAVGRPCRSAEELTVTYEDSQKVFDLYYFQPQDILYWDSTPHIPTATNDDFDQAVTRVFNSIVAKSDSVSEDIDQVLDIIADLHHGNRRGAFNRVLVFTGDLCQQLHANRLLTGDFNHLQDALQYSLEDCPTFATLRRTLKDYYSRLLPGIYQTASRKGTAEIQRVQQYIRDHFREDLSLKTLAEIACVSPHYFSAYYKAETGQNYKAFLTQLRMERALYLVLNTDMKSYEIADQVGYNNVRRFVDAFRSAYDMSPMDYRKLYKK